MWFKPAAKGNSMTNLQVTSYEGKPVLAYWEGHIDLGVGFGSDTLLGTDYKPVATIHAGNGYYADLHELQVTPQGSAYLTAYTLVRADLSSVHGSNNGALQDAVVQQIDIKTGLVMFEWHTYGHVALDDSYANDPRDPNRPWDFFHLNSIAPDPWGDGNFLISSRNTWAAYEVNHSSGAVEWRIGGKKPSFRMGSGTGTAYQHDARWQPDHTITIFDNGAVPKAHCLLACDPRADRLQAPHRQAAQPRRAHAGDPLRQPGQQPGARQRRLVRRLGRIAVLHRVQCRRPDRVRRATCPIRRRCTAPIASNGTPSLPPCPRSR